MMTQGEIEVIETEAFGFSACVSLISDDGLRKSVWRINLLERRGMVCSEAHFYTRPSRRHGWRPDGQPYEAVRRTPNKPKVPALVWGAAAEAFIAEIKPAESETETGEPRGKVWISQQSSKQ